MRMAETVIPRQASCRSRGDRESPRWDALAADGARNSCSAARDEGHVEGAARACRRTLERLPQICASSPQRAEEVAAELRALAARGDTVGEA